jgi:hypothetical protein
VVVILWELDLQLHVSITTKVLSSTRFMARCIRCFRYNFIQFVSDFRQTGGFPWGLQSPIKTDCHDITEALLKASLNTITQANLILIPSPPFVLSLKDACIVEIQQIPIVFVLIRPWLEPTNSRGWVPHANDSKADAFIDIYWAFIIYLSWFYVMIFRNDW